MSMNQIYNEHNYIESNRKYEKKNIKRYRKMTEPYFKQILLKQNNRNKLYYKKK